MSVVTRGIKNAFRNWLRTLAVVLILALGIGLSLSMLVANEAVNAKINDLKASLGTKLLITPAGSKGFEGGGNALTNANLAAVQGIPHVVSASAAINFRLQNQDSASTGITKFMPEDGNNEGKTNLMSPIEPGALGRRNSGASTTQALPANFSLPINGTGTTGTTMDGTTYAITSGRNITASDTGNVAIVGRTLAAKNNLNVGSTFTAHERTFTVVGIFDQGNTFENAGVAIPLGLAQTLIGAPDGVTIIAAHIDTYDNVAGASAAISSALGSDKADVSAPDQSIQSAIDSLKGVQQISIIAFVGALVAAAIIIFMIMMMIVRERKREIGVLKAIGGSNTAIVSQFVVESLVLVLLGTVVGFGISLMSSNGIANALVSSSAGQNDAQTHREQPGGGPGIRVIRLDGHEGLDNTTNLVGQVAANVGWTTVAYGLLAAVGIAVVGSAVPAWLISKVRPAIVLRGE